MISVKELSKRVGLKVTPEVELEILSALQGIDLSNTLSIGRYGQCERINSSIEHDHSGAINEVSVTIMRLVSALENADPQKALRQKNSKSGLLSRYFGRDIAQQAEYVGAIQSIEQQLNEVPARIERLETIVVGLDRFIHGLLVEQEKLKIHIVAGQLFLEKNPSLEGDEANPYGLNTARDRFIKRIQNLAVLLTSNSSALHQMELSRSNSINMLDRLHEVSSVLIPSWRSHRSSVYLNNQDYEAIKGATVSHEKLVESLKSL